MLGKIPSEIGAIITDFEGNVDLADFEKCDIEKNIKVVLFSFSNLAPVRISNTTNLFIANSLPGNFDIDRTQVQ